MNVTRIENIPDAEALKALFAKTKETEGDHAIGWDIETTPIKDFFWRRCRTIQFGNTQEQHVIDLLPFFNNDPELLFSAQGSYGAKLPQKAQELLKILTPVVATRDFLKVGVSLSFEYQMFYWLFGIRTFHFYDCAMAEKCILAGASPLKRYATFSMQEMVERYFNQTIDKQYQESFTLDAVLSDDQIAYAALDTRFPIGLRAVQQVIAKGTTLKQLKLAKSTYVKYFENLRPQNGAGEPIIMGDDLREIIQIENDGIGAFEDMHIHGDRLDRVAWKARVDGSKAELKELVANTLDPILIPFVGNKNNVNTDADIDAAEVLWKSFNVVSDKEIALRPLMKAAKAAGNMEEWAKLELNRIEMEDKRKTEKEIYKTACGDMKKTRTKVKNLSAKCIGDALINYSSDTQLLAVVNQIKGLQNVTGLDDEILEKYEAKGFAIMGAIRKLHGLTKEIGTYGDQWAQEWTTKPCKEEGWLHPGDGRLHCVYNQYDAETGRSSSEKPNGQNLPQDEAVRSCFIADDPNELIRISDCCQADTTDKFNNGMGALICNACGIICTHHAEEYVIITADMSGAELRIIAELAQDLVWIGAFLRGEDVHSVGTELLRGEAWAAGTLKSIKNPDKWFLSQCNPKKGGETVLVVDGKAIGPCAYYAIRDDNGEVARQKCDCPVHKEQRNENKSTNFLLAYGGGPGTLAKAIKKKLEQAQELMALHSAKFPRIWAYLEKSGKTAVMLGKSFDMYGRRRLFPEPTWDLAKARFIDDNEVKLRVDEEEGLAKIEVFKGMQKRLPNEEETYLLTHREPTQKEIGKQFGGMKGSIERQGKNHAIQGTNATIIKLAMGCGYDADGKPYLWHLLPQYRAKLIKMVHDEVVIQAPKQYAKIVAELVGDAFKRAAAVKMRQVVMEFDFNIAKTWKK